MSVITQLRGRLVVTETAEADPRAGKPATLEAMYTVPTKNGKKKVNMLVVDMGQGGVIEGKHYDVAFINQTSYVRGNSHEETNLVEPALFLQKRGRTLAEVAEAIAKRYDKPTLTDRILRR